MKVTIEFSTDNAAFEDNHNELEHVLSQAEEKVLQMLRCDYQGGWPLTLMRGKEFLRDSNGNTVGSVTVER